MMRGKPLFQHVPQGQMENGRTNEFKGVSVSKNVAYRAIAEVLIRTPGPLQNSTGSVATDR